MTIITNFNQGETCYTITEGDEVVIESIEIKVYENVFKEETTEIIYNVRGGNCARYEESQLTHLNWGTK